MCNFALKTGNKQQITYASITYCYMYYNYNNIRYTRFKCRNEGKGD